MKILLFKVVTPATTRRSVYVSRLTRSIRYLYGLHVTAIYTIQQNIIITIITIIII